MENEEYKGEVLSFVRSYYAKEKVAPSVGMIVNNQGLTCSMFYAAFPDGLAEACRATGIPIPERLEQTKGALKARKKKDMDKTKETSISPIQLVLTEEQSKRLLGISHLEGGKDPSLIIDEMLDRDSNLRKTYKLSFSDTRLVVDFLKKSLERKWSLHSDPNIVEFVTRLWNCGVQNLDPKTVEGL